ncbi:hypothetical protein EVAR_51603_1 [Eumeta japonica]|uniref:Uncharacterized protein n=1 Tax=Eumeta variegata TaxID=151549 RepID=A0A4C1YF81_EUMVA|nr:hypothetical protein EVAR_51603_1 [Eumeta japonica]
MRKATGRNWMRQAKKRLEWHTLREAYVHRRIETKKSCNGTLLDPQVDWLIHVTLFIVEHVDAIKSLITLRTITSNIFTAINHPLPRSANVDLPKVAKSYFPMPVTVAVVMIAAVH